MRSPTLQKTADITGVVLSQLCLVHCLLLPVLLGFLPSLAILDHGSGELFHAGLLILATPVTVFALLQGYRRHRNRSPILLGTVGLCLLWSILVAESSLGHDFASVANVMAGALVASAHWYNWSLTRSNDNPCANCSSGH